MFNTKLIQDFVSVHPIVAESVVPIQFGNTYYANQEELQKAENEAGLKLAKQVLKAQEENYKFFVDISDFLTPYSWFLMEFAQVKVNFSHCDNEITQRGIAHLKQEAAVSVLELPNRFVCAYEALQEEVERIENGQ